WTKTKELVTQTRCVIITTETPKLASSSGTADAGAMKTISKVSKNAIKYATKSVERLLNVVV
ncbi:hypothetical protein QMQ04_29650, partial [Escherichia coli]